MIINRCKNGIYARYIIENESREKYPDLRKLLIENY